ncbi:hypothetical protein KFL_011600010, partial [Klebsormidium nitens]
SNHTILRSPRKLTQAATEAPEGNPGTPRFLRQEGQAIFAPSLYSLNVSLLAECRHDRHASLVQERIARKDRKDPTATTALAENPSFSKVRAQNQVLQIKMFHLYIQKDSTAVHGWKPSPRMKSLLNLKRRQDAAPSKKALSFDETANMSGVTNLITGGLAGLSPFKGKKELPSAMETDQKGPTLAELFQDAKDESELPSGGPPYKNPDPLPCAVDELIEASDRLREMAKKLAPTIAIEAMMDALGSAYGGCVLDASLKSTIRIGHIYSVADIPGTKEKVMVVDIFACNPKLAGKKAAKVMSNIGVIRVAVEDALAEIDPEDQPLCAALLASNIDQTINKDSPVKAWETRFHAEAPTQALAAPPPLSSSRTPSPDFIIDLVGLEETMILSYTYMQDVTAEDFQRMTTPPLEEVKGFVSAEDLPASEGQSVGNIRLVWEDYTAPPSSRRSTASAQLSTSSRRTCFWYKTTMTINGGTLTEANVTALQQLIRERTKDRGAQLILLTDRRGPPKLQLTISEADTYFKIDQEKISAVLDDGKTWVLKPPRAELGPIFNDPMALIIESKVFPGHIKSADVLRALLQAGAPPETTVDYVSVGRGRRFFLVQIFKPQLSAKFWVGGLEMGYGKVVPVELAYLWKSDVLRSLIPNLSQEKAYDAVVKQNPRLLSSIMAAKDALRAAAKGAQGAEGPAEKKPRHMKAYQSLTFK